MVSKVAVIALVAIVACPILLGYALNLDEVSETGYVQQKDAINVTPLLQDSIGYSYAHADVYNLNSKIYLEGGFPGMPLFKSLGGNSSSLPVTGLQLTNSLPSGTFVLNVYKYFFVMCDVSVGYGYVQITLNGTDTFINIHDVYYNPDTQAIYYNQYYVDGGVIKISAYQAYNNASTISFSYGGTLVCNTLIYYATLTTSTYADFSDGFYLNAYNQRQGADRYSSFQLPQDPRSILFTMDLSSITASSYYIEMFTAGRCFGFQKTTDGSGVHWTVYWGTSVQSGNLPNIIGDLFYDSSKSSNTYQIMIGLDHIEFRYVGAWPTLFGPANVYWQLDHEYVGGTVSLTNVTFGQSRSPLMRVDDAEYKAFEYPVIEDETYDPISFKSNPSTTITNITKYGTSLEFGGVTYTVSKGCIHLGSRDLQIEDLVFTSLPTTGGYENRIGNTVISTTANPSTIVMNGQWSANVQTTSNALTTYTKTEWKAGDFAWDGIDQNFLMAGLITSIGVFIALGIYARKSRSGGIIPLMIIVGGAAMLFFVML